jgi:cytochrome P450
LEETARGMLFLSFSIYVPSLIDLANIQSSAIPASIWLIAQLFRLSDQKELSSEIQRCVFKERNDNNSTQFDIKKLLHLPLMKSAFSEMLRLHDDGGSLREIAHDTTITVNNREYLLENGDLVVFPFSCVHKDPDIYENPRTFQVDRFLPQFAKGDDRPKKVEKNGTRIIRPFVPFGGGVNQV